MQRILLVEDSAITRALLVDVLEQDGQRQVVAAAETEEDAFKVINIEPVDVAIIDINLREGSGIGLLARMNKLEVAPRVRIVYTNAYNRSLHELCKLLGATAVISKRGDLTELLNVLEQKTEE